MPAGSGRVSVPPGFRFHPTDEELLYYYLRKKVSYEDIDLDVIKEVDLNKLEPWDLKGELKLLLILILRWNSFSNHFVRVNIKYQHLQQSLFFEVNLSKSNRIKSGK